MISQSYVNVYLKVYGQFDGDIGKSLGYIYIYIYLGTSQSIVAVEIDAEVSQ